MRVKNGEEKTLHIEYGYRRVKLPGREEEYAMVVAKGFAEESVMLLTTLPARKKRNLLEDIVRCYITRWRIEEAIRFIKQSYRLEDIRVLTYQRLKNLVALVLAASYFAAVSVCEGLRLTILMRNIYRAAKRLFGIPPFHYYALADRIAVILVHATVRPLGAHTRPLSPSPQLPLGLFDG